MPKKEIKPALTGGQILRKTWKIISIGISTLLFLIFAMVFFSVIGSFIPSELATGNIAVIPIEGIIQTNDDSFTPGTKSETIVELIEKATENEDIKAILLEIDSPGGTPVATD